MNAWDYIGRELAREMRWDWSFVDGRIMWPVILAAGICILLAVLNPDRRLGNRYQPGSHEDSDTTKRRGQGA